MDQSSYLTETAAGPSPRRDLLPLLLPGTRQCSQYLDEPLPAAVHLVALAPGLERAVPRRQLQFRAGRYCAMKAIEMLDGAVAPNAIDRAATGSPVWPSGVIGSITHTDDFVAAAVASTTMAVSLGIDTERIMSAQQALDVRDVVASPAELERCGAAGITPLEALTLLFSLKESVFKCLHPLVGRMFEFDDVRLIDLKTDDTDVQVFWVEIVNSLNHTFIAGTVLEGRFTFADRWVHSGMLLPVAAMPPLNDRRSSR